MFGAAIIVFRETLEAALLIGIVAAATRGLPPRNRWLALGIGAGLAGSPWWRRPRSRSPTWPTASARNCSTRQSSASRC